MTVASNIHDLNFATLWLEALKFWSPYVDQTKNCPLQPTIVSEFKNNLPQKVFESTNVLSKVR